VALFLPPSNESFGTPPRLSLFFSIGYFLALRLVIVNQVLCLPTTFFSRRVELLFLSMMFPPSRPFRGFPPFRQSGNFFSLSCFHSLLIYVTTGFRAHASLILIESFWNDLGRFFLACSFFVESFSQQHCLYFISFFLLRDKCFTSSGASLNAWYVSVCVSSRPLPPHWFLGFFFPQNKNAVPPL